MEYSQHLSQRALDCLSLIKVPTEKEIWQQRSEELIWKVGTYINDILKEMDISIHVLRKILQKELYWVVWVFYNKLDICHTASLIPHNAPHSYYDEIRKDWYQVRYTHNWVPIKLKTKKDHPRQVWLYIPESITQQIEESIDDEYRLFSKDIDSESLHILEYILERSLFLREKYGNNWYPFFSDKSISRNMEIDLENVKKSTKDLVWILCQWYILETMRVWQKRYFLPSSKFWAVKTMLR